MSDLAADRPASGVDAPATIDAAGEAGAPAGPTSYVVATTGSDQAAGTLATPFRTIQRCATVARPGDRCLIRAGTYRETVTPARSGTAQAHISFEAYQGECVLVSGAEPLAAVWKVYQGSIYVADTPLRFIQLFAGGKMLNEARWPNADPDDLIHMPLAVAGPATTATTLQGPTLPAGDWTSAYVFSIPGSRWISFTRRIESYDQGTKIATWTAPMAPSPAIPAITPRARDTYYVFGSLLALDTAGEWFLDTANGKVYLWAPGSVDPTGLAIEVKQRDYAFNLGARAYVDLKGLRLFAASVRLTGASHCVVDGLHLRYPSHLRESNGYDTGKSADNAASTWTPTESGLVVSVSNAGGGAVQVSLIGPTTDGGAGQTWCARLATFGAPVLIPWEKFNTKCWDDSGAFYARAPLFSVGVSVPGGLTDQSYDFCVNGLSPQMETGTPSLESPPLAVRAGKLAASSSWEGVFWSWTTTGSTLALPGLSATGVSTSICATGTVKGTTDYSGGVGIGFNLAQRVRASAAPALDGDALEWKNGSIAFAAAEGIVAAGSDGHVTNNVVHDVGTMAAGNGGITADNPMVAPMRNEISGNTLTRCGRMGITDYGDAAAHITGNRVSQAMQLVDDGGLVYVWGTTATSAEIDHNHLSDIPCVYGTGIYLDDRASGFVVHHNFIHDTSWYGVSLKMPNRYVNNTILRTPLGAASIYKNDNTTWVDLSSAAFSNNLVEQRPGVTFATVQQQTTDYGDYQVIVPVDGQWRQVTLPFASLRQPTWAVPESLDLTNLTALTWTVSSEGPYQVDVDDVWLEGPTRRLLDDFDGGASNQLGGAWQANCGSGSTCARSAVTGFVGNATRMSGTAVREGFADLDTRLAAGSGPVDLSAYTGVSFRIRGTATLALSNGTATTTPVQEHNLECPVDGNGLPTSTCPVDQGAPFSPYTDGFGGAAPDVGAFESGQTPWTAGATTVEPTDMCPG